MWYSVALIRVICTYPSVTYARVGYPATPKYTRYTLPKIPGKNRTPDVLTSTNLSRNIMIVWIQYYVQYYVQTVIIFRIRVVQYSAPSDST